MYWKESAEYVYVEERLSTIKGRMVVALDGVVLYQKGPANIKNPQPTLSEIEELMETLFPEYPYTDIEKAELEKLHAKHIIDFNMY
jgi:hypothetical protein